MIKKLEDVIDKPETQNKCLLTFKLLGIYVKAPQFTNLFIVDEGIEKIVTLIKILKIKCSSLYSISNFWFNGISKCLSICK